MSNTQPWDYFPLLPLFAFTDIEKARKKIMKMTGEKYHHTGKSGTFSHYVSKDSCGEFGIIYLDCDDKPASQKYAILAHECVHYARAVEDSLGAERFEEETEAYIVQSAMLACIDQIGEEWFNVTPQA